MPGLESTPTLRGYVVGNVIGTGAYSWVRVAKDNRKDRVVALKIFNTAQYKDESKFAESLKREVLIQKSLKHENIIALLDVVQESPWVCMVLEMAAGGELFDKIAPDVGVDQDLAHLYFVQLIHGVEYLHKNGVVHRDLKPENLLLDADGNLKISDFGMSAVFSHKGKERELTSVKGSLPYIAPEVISKSSYAARPVDIWSSGIILYALLFGNTPWEAPTMASPEFMLFMERPDLDYEPWYRLDPLTKDLVQGILSINVFTRYTMQTIKSHPWFTQPNPYLVNGKCNDPINVATRLLSSMTVNSEPSDESTQQVSQEEDEFLSFSQPDALRRIGQTEMTEHEPHMLFSQPVARIRNDVFASPTAHRYPSTQAPSLTQVQRNFADICGIGKTNLTRFFSDANTTAEIIPRLCSALDGMLIANRPSTSTSAENRNVDAHIVVKTTDRRKCPLEGDILITNPKTRGGGRLALIAFEKRRGNPIEWKRLYRAITEQVNDLIVQADE